MKSDLTLTVIEKRNIPEGSLGSLASKAKEKELNNRNILKKMEEMGIPLFYTKPIFKPRKHEFIG